MKITRFLPIAAIALLTSCGDDLSQIGTSVDNSVVSIIDSTFQVSAHSEITNRASGRTIIQLIGEIDVPGYGNLRSDFLTQFMPATKLDTTTVLEENIDSLVLHLNFSINSFTGDSLAPMQLKVYQLSKTLEKPLYTDINPDKYYSENNLLAKKAYTASFVSMPDTLQKLKIKAVDVKLPREMALNFYREYINNPSTYESPNKFAQFFPGIYVQSSYGSGNVINIQQTVMAMYYRKFKTDDDGKESLYNASQQFLAVTPEINSVNHIQLTPDAKIEEAVNNGDVYIQAPVGYDAIINFPAQKIIDTYKNRLKEDGNAQGVLNTISFKVPAFSPVKTKYNIEPPQYLLFIRKSKKDKFFEDKELPDNKNSFYATYNSTKKEYDFGNLRDYITNIMKNNPDGNATAEDEEIVLTPVWVYTETVSNGYSSSVVVNEIIPFVMGPALVHLDTENIKVNMIFSVKSAYK